MYTLTIGCGGVAQRKCQFPGHTKVSVDFRMLHRDQNTYALPAAALASRRRRHRLFARCEQHPRDRPCGAGRARGQDPPGAPRQMQAQPRSPSSALDTREQVAPRRLMSQERGGRGRALAGQRAKQGPAEMLAALPRNGAAPWRRNRMLLRFSFLPREQSAFGGQSAMLRTKKALGNSANLTFHSGSSFVAP
jgi:hypothetical protein